MVQETKRRQMWRLLATGNFFFSFNFFYNFLLTMPFQWWRPSTTTSTSTLASTIVISTSMSQRQWDGTTTTLSTRGLYSQTGSWVLHLDCITDARMLFLPPGAAILLAIFNRNHGVRSCFKQPENVANDYIFFFSTLQDNFLRRMSKASDATRTCKTLLLLRSRTMRSSWQLD